jgi:hypothetical protein
VRFRRDADGNGGYGIESVAGQNPIAVQDLTRFVGLSTPRDIPFGIAY